LSKTLSPALGLGWLVTPPRWTTPLRAPVWTAVPGILDQLALAEFIGSGGYDLHLRAARKRYRARRDALLAALTRRLPEYPVAGIAAGLHLLLLPPGGPADRFDAPGVVRRAAATGLHIGCVEQYRVNNRALDGALVLGYGNLGDAQVEEAVSRLAAAIKA
jgi:GntR family transcriptional regulator/MocR family aminotransferase